MARSARELSNDVASEAVALAKMLRDNPQASIIEWITECHQALKKVYSWGINDGKAEVHKSTNGQKPADYTPTLRQEDFMGGPLVYDYGTSNPNVNMKVCPSTTIVCHPQGGQG
jgi:hypothetical protein